MERMTELKVAVYARVSTGLQVTEGTSLESQINLCMNKAIELGFDHTEIQVYREEGYSGEEIERPAMNQLRQDIALGGIKHLIITHPDRLSRDLTDKLYICRELESKEIELIFVDTEYKSTPEGQLFFNLMSVIAQYELSLIKKRTVRGKLNAVKKDKKIMPMRVPPYGYDMRDQELFINPIEAEFVKKMYHWYVYENLTLRQIGERLYEHGAIPKRAESKNWSASSISKVLTSEIYIGKFYFNRRRTKRIKGERTPTGAPRKTYTLRDEKDWIELDVPAIIDKELFNLAQQQRGKNMKKSGNVKYDYLLKSLIRCGHCGRAWECTTYSGREDKETGKRTRYTCYRCPNRVPRKYGKNIEKCPTQTLRADQFDKFLWQMVLDALSNPKDYVERLSQKSVTIIEDLEQAAVLYRNQIEQKEREIEKIKIMFRRDIIDEQEMDNEIKNINIKIAHFESELTKNKKQIEQYNRQQYGEVQFKEISRKIKEFVNDGGAQLTLKQKRHIIDILVDEIIVTFEGNEVKVTAMGALDELKTEQYLQNASNEVSSCSQPQEIR